MWKGTALYISAILGAGVLVLPGQVASLAGPASLLAWTFSILLSVPLAFTFAQLASRFPDSGGVASYTRRAFGQHLGGVVGWWYFVAGSVGQAIVPLTAGYYIADASGLAQSYAPLFAAVILAVAVAVTLVGLRIGGTVQLVLAGGICLLLLLAIVVAVPQIRWEAFTPFAPQGVAGVGAAVLVLFYAFSGWEAIAHLAEDFKDVRRTLPRATLLTLFVVSALYLGVAFAVVGTGSYGTPELDNVSLGGIIGGQIGVSSAVALAIAATVICVGTTNAFLASVSRLGHALGKSGWAPAALRRTNRRGAPVLATLAAAGIGAAGLVAAVFGWGTSDLVYIPAVLVLTTYLVSTAAGFRLLKGGQKALPAIGFVLILAVVPSAGPHLFIPAALTAAALLYRALRPRTETTDQPPR